MLVTLNQLKKSYGRQEVLRGINLRLDHGEQVAITGPSGSGKSTLLKILAGIEQHDTGEISIKGQDLSRFTPQEMDEYRRHQIGIVFQQHYLLPQCSALENVLLPTLCLPHRKPAEARERALYYLDKAQVMHCKDKFPAQMSGGECQRVAVCRALINEPTLLLADEPTGSLDHRNALELLELFHSLLARDMSLIMVTHWPQAAAAMSRNYELQEGRFL